MQSIAKPLYKTKISLNNLYCIPVVFYIVSFKIILLHFSLSIYRQGLVIWAKFVGLNYGNKLSFYCIQLVTINQGFTIFKLDLRSNTIFRHYYNYNKYRMAYQWSRDSYSPAKCTVRGRPMLSRGSKKVPQKQQILPLRKGLSTVAVVGLSRCLPLTKYVSIHATTLSCLL